MVIVKDSMPPLYRVKLSHVLRVRLIPRLVTVPQAHADIGNSQAL
jgi:hypothetical protein